MSGYDQKFAKALIQDADFDNMIDADDDDAILAQINNEAVGDEFIKDKVDFSSIENGASGLGDDLGTKHPSTGAEAPSVEASHQSTVVKQTPSIDAKNVIDHKVDGQKDNNPDPEKILDTMDKVDHPDHFEIKREAVDNFDAAKNSLLEEAEEDIAIEEGDLDSADPEINTFSAPQPEEIAPDVDAATGLDTPIPTSPNDIAIGDGKDQEVNSVLSVGEAVANMMGDSISEEVRNKLLKEFTQPMTEGKFEDLAIGNNAEGSVKDGNPDKINDFLNVGEDRKNTSKDGQDLAVGNNAEGSVKDGNPDKINDFMVKEEDRKATDDDFKEAAEISKNEDLVDDLEDEDIDFVEDNDASADKLASDLANEGDEEDDILDQLID